MLVRRFLGCIFVLTLLAVAGALLIYQFGAKALVTQATPRGHYVAPVADSGPDYTQDTNWLSKPGLSGDPSAWLPDGVVASTEPTTAAVFYIHPTTYLERDRWNAPVQPAGDWGFRTNLFVQTQASAFNGVGQIWAPRYRQAAFGAFLLKNDDATKALDLAYRDVSAAFDTFLAGIKQGQPIILAAHSQGSLHLTRLLADKVAGKPIAKQIVAAYVGGWPISRTADLPSLGLPACATADQAGCLLSWQSFGDPANPALILDSWQQTKGPTGLARKRGDLVCTNPISGTDGGTAAPAANLGTLLPSTDFKTAGMAVGKVGAHCEGGFLILDGAIPPLGPYVLPGNNYHAYDYALFWGSIRADAARRMAAWQR